MNFHIGFLQGRLSQLVNGKIQAFPWHHWRDEFKIAHKHGFNIMEWTLDQDRLYENPLMTEKGRKEINGLMLKYSVSIPSVTGDCFMQTPFYKTLGNKRDNLLEDLKNIIQASRSLGIYYVIIPLVDGGRLESKSQEINLKAGLDSIKPMLDETSVMICFESDLNPEKLANFIDRFEPEYFGINYDIGNSASLGYDPEEEIKLYGHRIVNVHIKDRLIGGESVPLGEGNADFPAVLRALKKIHYKGNYILQTARAKSNDHTGVLLHYRNQVLAWLQMAGKN